MKYPTIALAVLLLLPASLMAQQPPSPPTPPAAPSPPSPPSIPNLGKWWKNSQVVRDLQLSDTQVKQIEQTFLDHRTKLSDARAELERQETRLQALLTASQLDDKKVDEQTAQVLAARGKLERVNTGMMIAFRRLLTADQWRKLEDIRRASKEVAPPLPPPPPPPAPPAPPAPPSPPTAKEVNTTASGEPIYAISGSVQAPTILVQPLPQYTPEAKEKKIEGMVLLQAVIDKNGMAHDVKILRGLGYGLDESAANTITKEWRFRPGTMDGKPVNVRANIEVSFRLY